MPSTCHDSPQSRALRCTRAVRGARAWRTPRPRPAIRRPRRLGSEDVASDRVLQRTGILERLAGALGEVLQHRMGGVAGQQQPVR